MTDPKEAGVSEEEWKEATASCHELRVARTVEETHDAISIVLEIPEAMRETFAYEPGQFLSFKLPYDGRVLVRSYSLASSPHADTVHKVTVKRVDDGRISNWMNDNVRAGTSLMVVPPAGFFVLHPGNERKIVLFGGGSGITPCISIIKSALATTSRAIKLVYANRDARSVIFKDELEALRAAHPDRFEIAHTLDDVDGYLTRDRVAGYVNDQLDCDFYLCGPAAFMDVVEQSLLDLGIDEGLINIERFVSPPDPGERSEPAAPAEGEIAPARITVRLDGQTHDVAYEEGERVLSAARRAGLDPPFSCEEGYCSCCMAKIVSGKVVMGINDCLTPELIEEGWVLTCQARCVSEDVEIEYPD